MSSYTSPDEARSDLFLSGAVYLFGGTVLMLLLGITGLNRLPVLGVVFGFAIPVLTTVLVPVLLMRYRGDSLRDLGVGGEGEGGIGPAIVAVVPIVGAAVVTALLAGVPLADQLPILRLGGPTGEVLLHVIRWSGLAFLALYCTVKARDAFRGEPVDIDEAVVRVGRFVGIACGGAIVVILLGTLVRGLDGVSGGGVLALLAYPLGVAAAVAVALRVTRGAGTSTMPTVLTPTILLALGPFGITFNAGALIAGIYAGALYAGIGLVFAVLSERTRRGEGVLVLGVVLGLGASVVGAAGLL